MKDKAIFKFNSGNLALLCSKCYGIIKVGYQFTESEKLACSGKKYLKPQRCDDCKLKVSFDFDGTLEFEPVQEYARELRDQGIEVHLTTSRKEFPKGGYNNEYLFEVARRCGIKKDRIHFTENSDKADWFINNPEYNFEWHLDDDRIELELISNSTQIQAIDVLYGNWKYKCNKILQMNLQERILDDLKISILENDTEKRNLLRVVIGEMNRVGKQLSDSDIIKILKKMVESAKECNNLDEIPILLTYLPRTLTREEVTPIIKSIIATCNYTIKDMGKIISECKLVLGDRFDGGLVSKIIKEIFN